MARKRSLCQRKTVGGVGNGLVILWSGKRFAKKPTLAVGRKLDGKCQINSIKENKMPMSQFPDFEKLEARVGIGRFHALFQVGDHQWSHAGRGVRGSKSLAREFGGHADFYDCKPARRISSVLFGLAVDIR